MELVIFIWILIGALLGAFDFMSKFQRYNLDSIEKIIPFLISDLLFFFLLTISGPLGIIFFFIL